MALSETAQLAVSLNVKGNFVQAMSQAQSALGKTTKALGSATAATGKLGKAGSDLKNTVLMGVGLGAGVTAFGAIAKGIGTAIDFMGDAVNAASGLEESQSKVNQVFTESSDVINRWASDSVRDFGLSERAALEAAGTFGNFIQALGNTEEQANSMSRTLVELAADLASFNNTGIEEVIIALRSGLAGEAEPMRRLGVSISETRVQANILAKGIAKTAAEITDAMKVAERYSIILEDTSKAQGDFDRTSGGLANQQRQLAAAFDNLSAELGKLIIGPLTDLMKMFNDLFAGPSAASGGLKEWISARRAETEGLSDAAGELNKAAGEWQDGLGLLEAGMADIPGFALINPGIAESVTLWREHGEALEQVGLTYNEFDARLQQTKREMEVTGAEAADLIMEWARTEASVYKVQRSYEEMNFELAKVGPVFSDTYRAAQQATDAYDVLSSTNQNLTVQQKAARESNRRLTAEIGVRAVRAAEKLTNALQDMASEGYGDVKDAAKATQRAIREAAKTDTSAAMRRELEQLARQRQRYFRQGEFESVAIIDARTAEINADLKSRHSVLKSYRLVAEAQAKERGDIQEVAKEFGVSTSKVRAMLQRQGGDIDKVKSKLTVLGQTDAKPEVKVVGAERAEGQLFSLNQKIALLRAQGAINLSVNAVTSGLQNLFGGKRAAGGPTQSGRAYLVGEQGPELHVERRGGYIYDAEATRSMMGGSQPISVYMTPHVIISAHQTQRGTQKVLATKRARANV